MTAVSAAVDAKVLLSFLVRADSAAGARDRDLKGGRSVREDADDDKKLTKLAGRLPISVWSLSHPPPPMRSGHDPIF